MSYVKKIDLVLENCEVITIDAENIGWCDIRNIQFSIWGNSCKIEDFSSCEELIVELYPKANIEYMPFGPYAPVGEMSKKEKAFDRLMRYNDITSCIVTYDDRKSEIYVPWEDDDMSGESNKLQSHYLSKNGALYIYIGNDGKALDHFDKDQIDSVEHSDLFNSEKQ